MHEDACVTFSNGSVHRGKAAVRTAFEKNFAAIRSESYRVSNVDWIRKASGIAVYRFDFAWSGYIDGKLASGAGRGTSVIVKGARTGDEAGAGDDTGAGGWRLLVEHLGPTDR